MGALEVLIPISFFACIVLCTFFIAKYRSETITKLGGPIPKTPRNPNSWKRIGTVVIGLSIGLLTSGLLFSNQFISDNDDSAGFIVTGIISLTVGAALILADKKSKNEENIDG